MKRRGEGEQMRNLFQTDSDDDESSEEDEDENVAKDSVRNSADDNDNDNESDVFITRVIRNVTIEEQQVGGSIAHRLWPAALYLAEFLMAIQNSNLSAVDDNVTSTFEASQNRNSARKTQVLQRLANMIPMMKEQTQLENDGTGNGIGTINAASLLCILELGAGIGLTGLQLATVFPNTRVLLTDLDAALPLLKRNVALNQEVLAPNTTIEIQRLAWGDVNDIAKAREWYEQYNNDQSCPAPLLIIAADCVYWEELHMPLEMTLSSLLSALAFTDDENDDASTSQKAMCIMASARRWKRDNSFYNQLGKATRTKTHTLCCACLQETITRPSKDGLKESLLEVEQHGDLCQDALDDKQQSRREILRVFGVEWLSRHDHTSSS